MFAKPKNVYWVKHYLDLYVTDTALKSILNDKRVFAFYTEIQDARQKWHENDFWQTVAEMTVNTL